MYFEFGVLNFGVLILASYQARKEEEYQLAIALRIVAYLALAVGIMSLLVSVGRSVSP